MLTAYDQERTDQPNDEWHRQRLCTKRGDIHTASTSDSGSS